MNPRANNDDAADPYDDTTIPRACPLCRTEIHSAPKPPALAFLHHLERVKAERRREEEGGAAASSFSSSSAAAAAAADDGGVSPSTRQRRQQGAEEARVARQTYQLQMEELKGLFDAERRRRERRRRRRVREGLEEGSETEEDGEGDAPIYDDGDRVWRCPRCTWEMDMDEGGCVNPRCALYGGGSDESEGEEWVGSGEEVEQEADEDEESQGVGSTGDPNAGRNFRLWVQQNARLLQRVFSDGEGSESSGEIPITELARREGRQHEVVDLMSSADEEEEEGSEDEGPARRRRRVTGRRREAEDSDEDSDEEAPRRRRRVVRRRQEAEPSDEEDENEEDGRRRIRRIFQAAKQQQQEQGRDSDEEADDDLGHHAGFGDESDVYGSEGEGDEVEAEVYQDAMEEAEEDEHY